MKKLFQLRKGAIAPPTMDPPLGGRTLIHQRLTWLYLTYPKFSRWTWRFLDEKRWYLGRMDRTTRSRNPPWPRQRFSSARQDILRLSLGPKTRKQWISPQFSQKVT